MKKQRQLPLFTIADTTFQVDINMLELRQTDNPANIISFLEMEDMGNHYRLLYDDILKGYSPDTDPYRKVAEVPPLIELDPVGMAEKYGYTIDKLKGKTDFEVMVDPKLLALRQQGILPKITICGEEFFIDVRLHELRHAENFSPQISLKRLDLSDDGEHYFAFYHPLIKQVVDIGHRLTALPEGVVLIEFPNELKLDPVGAARLYGLDEKDILRRYSIQKNLEAKVTPLSETGLPALIQSNLQKQSQEKQQEQQQEKERRQLRKKLRPRL